MTVVRINAITVPADSGDELARRFAARAGAVDNQDGFEGFELLKPTDGRTTYSERSGDSAGEWYVDDHGRFCSFWPPSYRACYALRWMVEDERIVGLRFTGLRDGVTFEGRYE